MSKDEELSPLAAEMVAGLSAFCDALESGASIEKQFTVRTVRLNLQPNAYGPEDVKQVRHRLNASQALLAKFLGISVKTLRAWEQGTRPVPGIACRYLDDIVQYPDLWTHRLREALDKTAGS
jgi:putative transcriptional regulator